MKKLDVFFILLFYELTGGLPLGIFLFLYERFIFKKPISLSIIPICMAGVFCLGLIVLIMNKIICQTRLVFSIINGSIFGITCPTAFFLIARFIDKHSLHPVSIIIGYILSIAGGFFWARNYLYPLLKDKLNKEKITDV